VAFSSDRSGESGIWLADPDGSNAVLLASMGDSATGAPRWSPDGKQIVFHSSRVGQPEAYIVPAAGGKPRNLTSHPALDAFPSFSRDGRWVYFNSNRSGDNRIWKMPASGGNAVQVMDTGSVPMESPDGSYLYYVETLDQPGPLWRVPVSGGKPERIVDGVVQTNYVVLERGIYYFDRPAGQRGVHYLDQPRGEIRLQYFDFATRRSTTVVRNVGNVDNFLTVSPDGRVILYCRTDTAVDDLMLVENFR
jgi:Tol biopolymer transport system component